MYIGMNKASEPDGFRQKGRLNMFKKTKDMTIKEIVHISVAYPAVLCRFAGNEYDVCLVDYSCDKNGENVVMKAYPIGWNDKHFGEKVEAYEVIFDEKERNISRWHGGYTDEEEPKKNERCYILVELKEHGRVRYKICRAVYDGKIGFYGYPESSELSVLGFLHISKNGMPF